MLTQIYWRLLYKYPRKTLGSLPTPRLRGRDSKVDFAKVCRPGPLMLQPFQFTFLNISRTVEKSSDWNHPEWEKLWLYNLHYFDDLDGVGAEERQLWHEEYLERWVDENPPNEGNGWEPYPTSLRTVNWIKWFLRTSRYSGKWHSSLALQLRTLARRPEYHLLGNHLFANAKALVFGGAYFEGELSDQWLKQGSTIIEEQIKEQILPDGGHFELSPMYHSIILLDVLDLIQLSKSFPQLFSQELIQEWQRCAAQMLEWLKVMTHPDGNLSFFNDAALGIAPTLENLREYAAASGVAWTPLEESKSHRYYHLKDSGYCRLENSQACLLLDVGRVGPDYLPGHAHADTLSFELSIASERILVNSGTSEYEIGERRQWQRGSAAHNTVVINGLDSSEVWGGFRVARRAYPTETCIDATNERAVLSGSHSGYRWLKGRPTHQRTWTLSEDSLIVDDQVSGNCESALAFYHFTPKGVLLQLGPSLYEFQIDQTVITIRIVVGEGYLEKTSFHPEFGLSQEKSTLVVELLNGKAQVQVGWGSK